MPYEMNNWYSLRKNKMKEFTTEMPIKPWSEVEFRIFMPKLIPVLVMVDVLMKL